MGGGMALAAVAALPAPALVPACLYRGVVSPLDLFFYYFFPVFFPFCTFFCRP
jgi:hypothetical protein